MDRTLQSNQSQGKRFVQFRDSRGEHHPTQLECGKFKVLFQLNCNGDTLFPNKGFFNEVTRIKEKRFKKTMSKLFTLTRDVRTKIKETQVKKSRRRQAWVLPRGGVAK